MSTGRPRRLGALELGDPIGDALFIGDDPPPAGPARTFAAHLTGPPQLVQLRAGAGGADAQLLGQRREAQPVLRRAQQLLDLRRLKLARTTPRRSRRVRRRRPGATALRAGSRPRAGRRRRPPGGRPSPTAATPTPPL